MAQAKICSAKKNLHITHRPHSASIPTWPRGSLHSHSLIPLTHIALARKPSLDAQGLRILARATSQAVNARCKWTVHLQCKMRPGLRPSGAFLELQSCNTKSHFRGIRKTIKRDIAGV